MKAKILIDPAFRPRSLVYRDEVWQRLHDMAEIVYQGDTPMPEAEFENHRDAAILCGGWWRYGDLQDWPNLRAFIETGGGLPSPGGFDYPTAFARTIRVLSCSPAFAPAVCEMGLTLALNCARQVARCDRDFRRGTEPWSHQEFRGEFTLYGKTLGFIGFGALGRQLKKLVAPWEPKILVSDPWMTDRYLETQGVVPSGLDDLLSQSDVVFVLATPSASNAGLLSRERLRLIRDGKVLVLLSRAHLVDFEALVDEVLAGRIFAGIDVFPEEPFDPAHRLRQAEHAVLSSHRAGSQEESIRAIGDLVARDIEAILEGKPPRELLSAEPEYLQLRGDAVSK